MVCCGLRQGFDLAHEAIARLRRGQDRLGGAAPPRPTCRAGVSHDAIPDRGRAPSLWPAASLPRPPALLRCEGRCGIRLTGTPAGVHALHVLGARARFLGWRAGLRLGWLLGQVTRMHHDQSPVPLRHLPLAVLHLHRAVHAWARPAARRGVLRPPTLFDEPRQRGGRLSPSFAFLTDGTRTRPEGHTTPLGRQPPPNVRRLEA
jgi:hypothetical protein